MGKIPDIPQIPPPPPADDRPNIGTAPPFVVDKPSNSATIPKEVEKQKIKRQLYNLIDRVDKL